MARFCNLVVEFNGLVSKRGQQQCWPFYMPASVAFQRFFVFFQLLFFCSKSNVFPQIFFLLLCMIFFMKRTHQINITFSK